MQGKILETYKDFYIVHYSSMFHTLTPSTSMKQFTHDTPVAISRFPPLHIESRARIAVFTYNKYNDASNSNAAIYS